MIRIQQIEDIDARVLSTPALLFLYYRVEKILGIRALPEALIKLNDFLEEKCGAKFAENSAVYERALSSRDNLFDIASLLTINETYFFREGGHFSLLLRNFLPTLAKLDRTIRICSAACSIGCEPYSIAMLIDFFSKKTTRFDYEVDAFDISAAAIETAKSARYTSNVLRTDGAEWKYILDSYLVPDGNEFIVSRAIKDKVRFSTHNIMDGLKGQYDVVFFRNALIYFTPENRITIMDGLAESLYNDGLLLLGISETSSVRHPLLINRFLSNVFYFQKISPSFYYEAERKTTPLSEPKKITLPPPTEQIARRGAAPIQPAKPALRSDLEEAPQKKTDKAVSCKEIAAILETQDGEPNAKKVREILSGASRDASESLSAEQLAAAAAVFLSAQDFFSADTALSFLENCSSSAVTLFLRGEYCFLNGRFAESEKHFEGAALRDRTFWPAFYRLSTLAAQGNKARYEYKIKKACESLELGKDMHYECFLGGFSPDYFSRILEKKLT